MRPFLALCFFALITWWIPGDMLLIAFAGSQLFSNAGTLTLFFFRSVGLFKNTGGRLYSFFGAWQSWLVAIDIYLLCCRKQMTAIPLIILFTGNLLFGAVVWLDIYRQKKQKNKISA